MSINGHTITYSYQCAVCCLSDFFNHFRTQIPDYGSRGYEPRPISRHRAGGYIIDTIHIPEICPTEKITKNNFLCVSILAGAIKLNNIIERTTNNHPQTVFYSSQHPNSSNFSTIFFRFLSSMGLSTLKYWTDMHHNS